MAVSGFTKLRHLYKERPGQVLTMLMALARGCFYICVYRLRSRGKVMIGFPFFCHTRIHINGQGRVQIGKGCSVFVNNFEHLLIHTLTEDAVVTIGDRCSLGGVTIRCAGRVNMGDHILAAAVLIQDVPYCLPVLQNEQNVGSGASPITIEDHVWLSGRSIVLQESRIGIGSVLGIGAVLFQQSVGAGYLTLGNLARRPLPIGNLMKMKANPT